MDGSRTSKWNSSSVRTPSFEESSATASLLRPEMGQPKYTSLSGKRGNLFSLVGIKNLFFKEEVKPVRSKRTYYGLCTFSFLNIEIQDDFIFQFCKRASTDLVNS